MPTVAILLVGLGIGLVVRRWAPVVVVAIVCLVVSALGTGLNWFGDQDETPLSGAILWVIDVWGPLLIGMAVGVLLRRRRAKQR